MSAAATVQRRFAARTSPEVLVDVGVAVATMAGTLALLAHGGFAPSHPGSGGFHPMGVVLAAGSTLPLIAWRRLPLGVFAATAAATVLLAGLGYPADPVLGPTVALYLLASSRERQRPWTWRTTAIVAGLLVAYLAASAAAQGGFPRLELQHAGLGWAVAWFAGERTRLRREQMAELRERAAHAKRDAERDRRLAVAEERARIARDLHDSAAHAINVIAVRAGAARLRHAERPDRSLLALQTIEEVARQTARDIDQIVHSLREGGCAEGGPAMPLGLASLDTLVAHHAQAGLEVTVRSSGDRRPLAHNADQAAYRILQEALTNAARHGVGVAEIELDFRDVVLELTVTNPVVHGAQLRSAGGHGLIGMRERAMLLGGTLEAHEENGAFRVLARIPYGG
jgi:signal transduction histidine kinase